MAIPMDNHQRIFNTLFVQVYIYLSNYEYKINEIKGEIKYYTLKNLILIKGYLFKKISRKICRIWIFYRFLACKILKSGGRVVVLIRSM